MSWRRMNIWVGGALMICSMTPAYSEPQSDVQANLPTPDLEVPHAPTASDGITEAPIKDSQNLAPDANSLTGARDLSLGVSRLRHSFWQPYINLTSTLDTNSLTTGHTGSLTTWSSLYGGIDLHKMSGQSDLTMTYLGGGLISNDGKASNSVVQQLELGDKLNWRRSNLSFTNQLSYLPEAAFGFGLPSGLSPSLGQGTPVQPVLAPNQSILTTQAGRISNTFLAELDKFLTPRSSLTFVGSYSVLHFLDGGFLNSSGTVFQVGYNRKATREDTVAVLYRFTTFQYNSANQSINSHVMQLSYGRQLTGRMAFQVAAGPGLGLFRTPLLVNTGASAGSPTMGGSSTQLYWTLDTSMTHQMRLAQLRFAYDHSLSEGAGVLAGAVNDQVSGSINSQLSRALNGGFVAGYARNRGISVATPTPSNQSYNYWFAGVNCAHPMGRSSSLFVNYRVQFQDSDIAFCAGATCGRSLVRHTLSIGFDWRSRPIAME
jgi:hypothetical protein